jgi:putative hydrolase of the HAD superfamily
LSKHFIFDLGNVLIDFDLSRIYRRVAELSGLTTAPDLHLQDSEKVVSVETGKISDQEYLDDLCKTIGIELTMEQLIGFWQEAFTLNPDGFALFKELKAQGCPIHFLSNLAWHNMEAIRRNWPDFFDQSTESFFSYELGFHKPDERIYRAALEHLDAKPEECFFLDDKPQNVDGARAVGMNAHLFSAENLPAIRGAISEFTR